MTSGQPARDGLDDIDEAVAQITDAEVDERLAKVLRQGGFRSSRAARQQTRSRSNRRRLPRRQVLIALSAISVLAAATVAAVTLHATPAAAPTGTTLTWSLAGYLVPKGWQLNTHGPAPGPLTCPTATTCYDQADPTGRGGAAGLPTLDRLYVSTDGARTWQDVPLPSGLAFTSALACQSAQICSAGAEDHGKPAFTITRDGGRTWTTSPLPTAAGVIASLSCPAATTCRALAGTPTRRQVGRRMLTMLTTTDHLLTTDDGRHFTTTTFPAAGHVYRLSCPTASHCVAAGPSLILVSDDSGGTWHPGTVPRGVRSWRSIDCVDARLCFQVGLRTKQDDDVLMVSNDGGATWQQRPLPARYPDPGIDSLACVSVSTCYITGWDDVPQSFDNGKATSGSTSIAAVTQDAGLTWQPIGLPEPSSSSLQPGEPPDVFMSVSSLQCPKVGTCIALADNVAGNKHAAIYTTAP
jgi:photosystem II stability/assembly factor-like uncharacterized protein